LWRLFDSFLRRIYFVLAYVRQLQPRQVYPELLDNVHPEGRELVRREQEQLSVLEASESHPEYKL
jgi:hypothetical protein